MTALLHTVPILCEEDWQTSNSPEQMADFLGEFGSRRRWQLFACACCWRILPLLVDERSRAALGLAECQAEGLTTPGEIADALEDAEAAVLEAWQPARSPAIASAALAARHALSTPRRAFVHAARATGSGEPVERLVQCRILRDLFGNPFRPLVVDPVWCTPTVLAIARDIYANETFAHLPVLADALEDAGCTDSHLLGHCRAVPAAHVRGCWVVDALLGKD